MMKTRNYYRPSTVSLGKKKRVARRRSGTRFFLKIFILLSFLLLCVGGGWLIVSKGYQLLVQTNLSQWQVKKVVVSGLTDGLQAQVLAQVQPYQGKSFSAEQSLSLRQNISQKYPMLKQVRVKRGLLSGTLTVSALRREPLAQFKMPDGSVKYIDADSTVYADPTSKGNVSILPVELEGKVPEKLSAEFIELVESILKLRKELNFAFLRMNMTDNTVKMYMPDESVIDFGQARQLKKKADRAAQILALAREKYPAPFTLDFRFFENGKVFLAQKAH
ncbi:MAG: hypothetical protein IKP06_02890 [Elusimicrobiaceae bacterium]|nr:hypothetical protein [Elusimicrobiaceae bacterium]